jgi:hypothetical protein
MVAFASLLLCNAINSKCTIKMTVLSLKTQMRNQSWKEHFTCLDQMTDHDLQNDKILNGLPVLEHTKNNYFGCMSVMCES